MSTSKASNSQALVGGTSCVRDICGEVERAETYSWPFTGSHDFVLEINTQQ